MSKPRKPRILVIEPDRKVIADERTIDIHSGIGYGLVPEAGRQAF